jgi:hypothetical protein
MQHGEYGETAVLVDVVVELDENAVLVGILATTCCSMFSARYARRSCWSCVSRMP